MDDDFDNDMDLDIVIASLYGTHYSRLYRNDGAAGFVDVTYETGTAVEDAVSPVWSDIDEDGDLAVGALGARRLHRVAAAPVAVEAAAHRHREAERGGGRHLVERSEHALDVGAVRHEKIRAFLRLVGMAPRVDVDRRAGLGIVH